MTTPVDERADLKKLQEKLAEKKDFGEAMQRLRRTQKMIAHRKREVKVVPPARGEWKTFRVYGSCRA